MTPIWKDIAVFLDATPEGAEIGRHAAALASRYGAHLVGIYGIPHSVIYPEESYARGSSAISGVISRMRLEDETKAVTAARQFQALATEFDISSEFRVVWQTGRGDEGSLRALHADLIVAAHPRPADLPINWTAEKLLLATGTPVLLVPSAWSGVTIGTKVLLAWNRSREARRAINDALPFITAAKAVTILTVDSDRDTEMFGTEPGANVAEHLARHGADARVANVSSDGASVANTILSEAVAHDADLLVIGAYSHPRTAELLFGGVTRSLLADTRWPMLISR